MTNRHPGRAAALLLTLTAVLACALPAGAADDYADAVAQSRSALEGLQSYDIQGSLHVESGLKGSAEGMSLTAAFDVAGRWPDRLLSSQTSDMFQLNFGTGPDGAWFYASQLQAAYAGAPVTLSRDLAESSGFELDPDLLYNFYRGIGELVLPDDLELSGQIGRETLTVGDREAPCLVFHAVGDTAASDTGEPAVGPRSYWFDPATGLCLKSQVTVFGRQGPMEVQQKMTYVVEAMTLDGDVADTRFTYAAPAGVRVVDRFERLLNPDDMTGESAPDVVLTGLDGSTFRLSDLRGQVVFLDLWATWCGPCRVEMPHIEKLHKELSPGGEVVFVAASNEEKATIEGFLAKNPYSFRIAMIDGEESVTKFKATSIPTGFVIDRDGTIRAHLVGAQSEAQLRAALAKAGIGE